VFLPIAALTIATALVFAVPAAHSTPRTFGTILSGPNEVPPVVSPGAGTAVVVLDPTAQTLQIIASFFGLTTPDTAAHIHCCAPLGKGLTSPPVFDLTQSLIYNPAFVTLEGGLPQAEAALIPGIEGGMTNMGGEIRGQLEPLGAH
jgi:CHRD domain